MIITPASTHRHAYIRELNFVVSTLPFSPVAVFVGINERKRPKEHVQNFIMKLMEITCHFAILETH